MIVIVILSLVAVPVNHNFHRPASSRHFHVIGPSCTEKNYKTTSVHGHLPTGNTGSYLLRWRMLLEWHSNYVMVMSTDVPVTRLYSQCNSLGPI